MRPHGPSRSLELWDARKESGTAPFSAGVSPDGILQLCCLAFYLFPPSCPSCPVFGVFFLKCVHVPCFGNGRAKGSSLGCCPGVAKGWEEEFPCGFLLGSRVSAEARAALVQRGRRAVFRATRAAAFPSVGAVIRAGGRSLHPTSITFCANLLTGKSKAIRKNLPKSLGCLGGEPTV